MILDEENVVTKTVRIETHMGVLNLKPGHRTPWGVVEIVHPLGNGQWFVGTQWAPGKKPTRRKSARLMDLLWKGNCKALFVAPLLPHSLSGDDRQTMAQAFTTKFGFRKLPGLDTGFPVVLSADNWPASVPLPQYAVLYRPPATTAHWAN